MMHGYFTGMPDRAMDLPEKGDEVISELKAKWDKIVRWQRK